MKRTFKDITGEKFGKLAVVAFVGRNTSDVALWECICDCGQTRIIQLGQLTTGRRTSCGCEKIKAMTKHGLARTKLYSIWNSMMARCYRPATDRYPSYGGRGITVCERWHDVANFVSDMGPSYKAGLTLEREDNSKGYSPENCCWATRITQARNKRNNRILVFDGQIHCVKEWSQKTGISEKTIGTRLAKGWSIHDTLTKPVAAR